MTILLTGAAGFIGSHLYKQLLSEGHTIIAIDNFSDYYSPPYKQFRLDGLIGAGKHNVHNVDIVQYKDLEKIFTENNIDVVCHLAAQAGVRYSVEHPFVYEETNIKGTLNLLELCRHYSVSKFVFASTSSVYGTNKMPFVETAKTQAPVSLYAASKGACELIAHSYNSMFGISCVGLRFFTVYGPWGRPDMAIFLFMKNILSGKAIDVYGNGEMQRDFTFVDDIVSGVSSAIKLDAGFEIINLGNSKTVELEYLIKLIEKELDKKAQKNYLPMQPGDFKASFADISKAQNLLRFNPQTSIEQGIKEYVAWFSQHQTYLEKSGLI